jgi:hypothetical protein
MVERGMRVPAEANITTMHSVACHLPRGRHSLELQLCLSKIGIKSIFPNPKFGFPNLFCQLLCCEFGCGSGFGRLNKEMFTCFPHNKPHTHHSDSAHTSDRRLGRSLVIVVLCDQSSTPVLAIVFKHSFMFLFIPPSLLLKKTR